jgi:hypothetical protein
LASQRGLPAGTLFGTSEPIYPPAAKGFARTDVRTEATVIKGETFRTGTKIAAASEEELHRNVQLVFEAVKHREFKDTTGLLHAINELLDQFDVARKIG